MKRFSLTFLGMITLLPASTLLAQEAVTPVFPEGIIVELESEKPVFQTGEPIVVFARLRNVGERPVGVLGELSTGYGTLKVEVAPQSDGPFSEYRGPGYGQSELEPAEVRLDPSDIVEGNAILLSNPGADGSLDNTLPAFPFPPGKYWIRVKAFGPDFKKGTVTSAAIPISVEDPQETTARDFAEKIKSNPAIATFIQSGDSRGSDEIVDTVRDFAQKDNRSPLGIAAAAALGHHYEFKDPHEALRWCRLAIANSEPSSTVRNLAELRALRLLKETGSLGERDAMLESGLREEKRAALRRDWDDLKRQLDRERAAQ